MMKKLVVLAVIMLMSIIATEMAFCQSQIYSGDKSSREIRKTIRIFRNQIVEYKKNVAVLNKAMINSIKRSTDSTRYTKQINQDSSLIISYRQKTDFLENQLDNLIATAAGKDMRRLMDLKSSDPRKAAEAYLLVKYADNFKSDQSYSARQAVEADSGKLKGIIVNNWYYEVTAQVTGPANFFREFNIKPNEKSPEFTLPFIGNYTTVFICGNECRAVSKKVGPNVVYYEGTVAYDYKATLLRYW